MISYQVIACFAFLLRMALAETVEKLTQSISHRSATVERSMLNAPHIRRHANDSETESHRYHDSSDVDRPAAKENSPPIQFALVLIWCGLPQKPRRRHSGALQLAAQRECSTW